MRLLTPIVEVEFVVVVVDRLMLLLPLEPCVRPDISIKLLGDLRDIGEEELLSDVFDVDAGLLFNSLAAATDFCI